MGFRSKKGQVKETVRKLTHFLNDSEHLVDIVEDAAWTEAERQSKAADIRWLTGDLARSLRSRTDKNNIHRASGDILEWGTKAPGGVYNPHFVPFYDAKKMFAAIGKVLNARFRRGRNS